MEEDAADDEEEESNGSRRLERDRGGDSATFLIVEYIRGNGSICFPPKDFCSDDKRNRIVMGLAGKKDFADVDLMVIQLYSNLEVAVSVITSNKGRHLGQKSMRRRFFCIFRTLLRYFHLMFH